MKTPTIGYDGGVTSDETLELLESAVALRVEGRDVPERVRRSLAAVESRLVDVIGPVVRKRVAARLLGCSVQALDRWIAKGTIPVEPIAEGSKHVGIPTDVVIGIAAELGDTSRARLGNAVDAWNVRRRRVNEYVTARNLTHFSHQIAAAARNRAS